jgi:A/G-specific adenine glycosylase
MTKKTKHLVKQNSLIRKGKVDSYEAFLQMLYFWYQEHKRKDLPWRKTKDPYAILVSELMLQQTQVVRVVPKYELWMKTYPTLAALSKARLGEVLALWKGLGYQRRAKALFQIAKEHKAIPKKYDELLTLPGVGSYTASAIMAFAYNVPLPMLETNIRTVLIEVFHPRSKVVGEEILGKYIELCLSTKAFTSFGARELYYAFMDYGAYLKSQGVSHNARVKGYRKQTPYKDSMRKLRAEVLFAINEKKEFPKDVRVEDVLRVLAQEGFIKKTTKGWKIIE